MHAEHFLFQSRTKVTQFSETAKLLVFKLQLYYKNAKERAELKRFRPLLSTASSNYSFTGVTLTYDLPLAFFAKETVPSTRAKRV